MAEYQKPTHRTGNVVLGGVGHCQEPRTVGYNREFRMFATASVPRGLVDRLAPPTYPAGE